MIFTDNKNHFHFFPQNIAKVFMDLKFKLSVITLVGTKFSLLTVTCVYFIIKLGIATAAERKIATYYRFPSTMKMCFSAISRYNKHRKNYDVPISSKIHIKYFIFFKIISALMCNNLLEIMKNCVFMKMFILYALAFKSFFRVKYNFVIYIYIFPFLLLNLNIFCPKKNIPSLKKSVNAV